MDTTEGGIGLPNEMEQANEEIDRLKAENARLRDQRDRATAWGVQTVGQLSRIPPEVLTKACLECMPGIDPAEAARLAALVFGEEEGKGDGSTDPAP